MIDVRLTLHTASDVPTHDDWLSVREQAIESRIRAPHRRSDWRLGRWTAKCAVAAEREIPLTPRALRRIEVIAAADGAPEAWIDGVRAPFRLSLTHRAGTAVCAVTEADAAVGIDLETIEDRGHPFVETFFTPEEAELVASADPERRAVLASLLWGAKESAFKALRVGLRMDTREVEVAFASPDPVVDGWHLLALEQPETGRSFEGWWRCFEHMVLTVVSEPPCEAPGRAAGVRGGWAKGFPEPDAAVGTMRPWKRTVGADV